MKTLSVTDTEQLIMYTALYVSYGLAAAAIIISAMIWRTYRKKEKVSKDINRDFKFI